MVNATCQTCGADFSYEAGRGRPRSYCDDCRRIDTRRRVRTPTEPTRLTCNWCGDPFVGVSSRRYCSDECRHAFRHRPRGACSECAAPIHKSRTSSANAVCRDCQRKRPTYRGARPRAPEVETWECGHCGKVCERKTARGQKPKWCSQRCADLGKKGERRTCIRCGAAYFGLGEKFCSIKCVPERHRVTTLVHVGPRPESWSWAPPVEATVVTSPKWWSVLVAGPCAWCGDDFVGTGSTTVYCSKRCREHAGEARRGGRFLIPPTQRREIYERDDWTCQLCFEAVDATADPSSDWFPSLDHIVPQSHTLIPDHSPENLRTAHRWCNAVRGDGTYHADFFQEAS